MYSEEKVFTVEQMENKMDDEGLDKYKMALNGDNGQQTDHQKRKSDNDSIYSILRPMFIVSMLLGMTPLTNVLTHSSRQLSFRWLSLQLIYSVVIVVGLCLGLYLMSTSYSFILSKQQEINEVVLGMTAPVFYFANTLSVIQLISVSRKLPILFQYWDQVAVKLTKYLPEEGQQLTGVHNPMRSLYEVHISRKMAHLVIGLFTVSALIEHTLHDFNLPVHLCKDNYTNYFHCYLTRGNEEFNEALGHGPFLAIVIFVVQKYANVAWNFHDLIIIMISLSLRANFRVIAQYVSRKHAQHKSNKEWREIREDHLALIDLTEKLDKVFSPMVLQSYAVNLFFLCLQVSLSIRPANRTSVQMAYFIYSLLHLVIRTCGVTASAASVHEQAHDPLQYLFDCPTNAYCTEVYRFTSHLMNIPVGFTGFQFFVVDRKIFLALLSVIITYELILLKLS